MEIHGARPYKNYEDVILYKGTLFFKKIPLPFWLVEMKASGEKYYFLEESLCNFSEVTETGELIFHSQASYEDALALARCWDNIELESVLLSNSYFHSNSNQFQSFDVVTNQGLITLGYGYQHKMGITFPYILNWPFGLVASELQKIEEGRKPTKGDIFSLLGPENMQDLTPHQFYHNPFPHMEPEKACA